VLFLHLFNFVKAKKAFSTGSECGILKKVIPQLKRGKNEEKMVKMGRNRCPYPRGAWAGGGGPRNCIPYFTAKEKAQRAGPEGPPPLPQAPRRHCPLCGQAVAGDDRCCRYCGAQLEDSKLYQNSSDKKPPVAKKESDE